jgi:membrane associated rhomboid family serine protease
MTPMVKRMIIINAAVWLGEIVLRWAGTDAHLVHLAITPNRVFPGLELWQPLTYMWLHSPVDYLHIVFNLLFLWMFGGTLELSWGSKAFLRFYLYCGVGAGLVVFVSGKLFAPDIPVLGASGAIYGLVVAWAIAFPNRLIYFFGIFPMKGKHFVLIPIGFAVLDFLTRAQGVSHAAHLGGMAIGALLVTGYWQPDKAKRQLRYWWLRRRLKVLEGDRQKRPPDGGYWH